MTYKFDNLNGNAEIVDPTIEYKGLFSWDIETKDAVILALLTTPNGSKFNVELNVNLPTVNAGTIASKGAAKLKDFEA